MAVKRNFKLTLLVDKELHDKLAEVARQESRSMHKQILVMLRESLERREKAEEEAQ